MKPHLVACCVAFLALSARAGRAEPAATTPSPTAKSVTTTERTVTEIAKGIYVIRHRDAPDTNPKGTPP